MTSTKSKILVVDDDEFIREMLVARLEWHGYEVATAGDGREALALRQQKQFDLILLDIMMPEMDGFRVLQHLRSEQDKTPVVVMSALDDMNSIVRCIELGAEDYLSKPIHNELLWARIETSLEKKHFRDREQRHLAESNLLRQIDQELNTTLNREEVARITLCYAQEKTGAIAGLIGSIVNEHLYLLATKGIPQQIEQIIPLANFGLSQHLLDLTSQPLTGTVSFHPDATHHLIFHIHRSQIVRCLLILELTEKCPSETLDFLHRLITHAAIAMHNAQLYQDVQAANQAKTNFVAMVSHELKNPLMVVQSYSDLLLRGLGGELADKQRAYLQVIRESSERIHVLSLELDDITRVETGQFKLKLTDVALFPVVQEVARLLAQQLDDKQQQLYLEIPEGLPLVRADGHRLNQILTNLISNASKYSPEKSSIFVSAHTSNDMVHVLVKDAGVGIESKDQKWIFTQFFRAEDERVRAERGTGLGLYITKKLVELQGGQIGFSSDHGKGSTFFFLLPTALRN